MIRRLTLAFMSSILVTVSALGVSPQRWTVDTTEEFLAGEVNGFAISTRGEILPGPAIEKLTDVSDPFVLSQASDGKGTHFIGTGNSGHIYRFRGGKLELIHKVPEPEVYAMAFVRGTLVVGSSPNGKLYTVDPGSGAAKELFDPEEAYIWCIAAMPDGTLLVGTGLEGRIYKVGLDGKGSVLFDSPDTHIRSLAVAGSRILAGSAGTNGRIYEITPAGVGRALYESSYSEISAVEFDQATGAAWAGAVTTVLPTTAPTRTQKQQSGQQGNQGGDSTQEDASGSTSVDVSFSFGGGQAPAQAARVGSSEVLRIEPDGFVSSAKRFEREIVYALRSAGKASVDVATGPSGRIYRLADGDVALIASVPEKQIVTLAGSDRVLVTTTNAGAIYELASTLATAPELRSKVGDASRFSTFGSYRLEGRGLANAELLVWFRSGNTSTADETWSAWLGPVKGAEGAIPAPAARYLQWKIQAPKPADGLRIDSVTCSYVDRNIAPEIDNVTLHDPGVVFISSSYPSSPQVLEATNPDEYGIFNSLDNPSSRNDPGKRLFRKSYRTLTWRASDDNGDELRYTLQFRPEGSGPWLRLRENMNDTNFNFDTSQLPDGTYELRLIVSDERSNPGEGLDTVRDGVMLLVDNTSPVISTRDAGESLEVVVRDEASPVVKAEYSIDAKEWIQVVPVEGLADSREERYRIPRKDVRGHLVIFRALDAQYNVVTANVGLSK